MMKPDTIDQQITNPQPKQDWSKPELTLISVNDHTLGVNNSGADIYASQS